MKLVLTKIALYANAANLGDAATFETEASRLLGLRGKIERRRYVYIYML